MARSKRACATAIALLSVAMRLHGEQLPIAAFAQLPEVVTAAISPDGQRVVLIGDVNGTRSARVLELASSQSKLVLASNPPKADLSSCAWANDQRLLCLYRGIDHGPLGDFSYWRLVAVNADGSNMKVLINDAAADESGSPNVLIDWIPADPDTVLVQARENVEGIVRLAPQVESIGRRYDPTPSVFQLNVYNGNLRRVMRAPGGFGHRFVSDGHGNVRLAMSIANDTASYYVRVDDEWRRLTKADVRGPDVLKPIGMADEPNSVYALGPSNGRQALWKLDLTDQRPPELIFEHPAVDVGPVFGVDGALIGSVYEVERPFLNYFDAQTSSLIRGINAALPNTFNFVMSRSRNGAKLIVFSQSDVDAGTVYLAEPSAGKLQPLLTAYPDLQSDKLARMKYVTYPARDGTSIPAYLTVPSGARAERLPLIVMPHDGPVQRDDWAFDYLRHFLANRGYAVLQMNFRGSWGFGEKWFVTAHQDWGGLIYSDIVDGAKWAISSGIADPQRVCIVGRGLGGYEALLGALRDGDLFHCAGSIGGFSDLSDMQRGKRYVTIDRVLRVWADDDRAKLQSDAPVRHAAQMRIPVFLAHAARDVHADADQSRHMAAALKSARKPFKFIELEDAVYQLSREADRVTLLTELERFLREQLGPGATSKD